MNLSSVKKAQLSLLIIEDDIQLNSLFCEILDEDFKIYKAFSFLSFCGIFPWDNLRTRKGHRN